MTAAAPIITVKSVASGAKVTLTLTVSTGGQPVDGVQAYLTFPDAQLDCTKWTLRSTFTFQAAQFCDSSSAAIAVATQPGQPPFTGKAVVAKVTLTAAQAGAALVGFDRSRTLLPNAVASSDILKKWNTSTITVVP